MQGGTCFLGCCFFFLSSTPSVCPGWDRTVSGQHQSYQFCRLLSFNVQIVNCTKNYCNNKKCLKKNNNNWLSILLWIFLKMVELFMVVWDAVIHFNIIWVVYLFSLFVLVLLILPEYSTLIAFCLIQISLVNIFI